jgi:hypothetical protein
MAARAASSTGRTACSEYTAAIVGPALRSSGARKSPSFNSSGPLPVAIRSYAGWANGLPPLAAAAALFADSSK